MNPFEHANTNVTSSITNTRKEQAPIREMMQNDFFGNMRRREEDKRLDAVIESKMAFNAAKERQSALTESRIRGSRLRDKINKIGEEAKEAVFTNLLLEMYTSSLLLDEDFKQEKKPQLEGFITDYIQSNGGYSLLEKACRENADVPLLHEMKNICEEMAKLVCDKKYAYAMENKEMPVDDLSFGMDDECRTELLSKKDSLDIEKLSDAVKNKVLTVIKDEKERQEEEKAYLDELEELSEEEKKATESIHTMQTGRPLEVPTLFNAIMRNSYKEMLEAATATDNDLAEFEAESNINLSDPNKGNRFEDYLNAHRDDGNFEEKDAYEATLNMDMVLAESVAKYTLLELAHTIKLEKFNSHVTENMILNLMYGGEIRPMIKK